MLPGDVSLQQLIPTTGPLRCDLPRDQLERAPAGIGPAMATENDQRRFRRQPVFCAAALQHATTIKALPRACGMAQGRVVERWPRRRRVSS